MALAVAERPARPRTPGPTTRGPSGDSSCALAVLALCWGAMNTTDIIAAKLEPAVQLLSQARDARQAKQVADLAHAAEVYARRQKLSEDAITYATAVKVDAMTLMGEFLRVSPKNTGTAGNGRPRLGGSPRVPPKLRPATLAEVGIGKKESAEVQALADIKTADPDLHERARQGKVPVSRVVQAVRRNKRLARKRTQLAERARAAPVNGRPPWDIKQGDCLDLLAAVAPGSVALVFADPPYNIGIDYGEGEQADRLPDDVYLAGVEARLAACKTALAPSGALWVLIGDEYAAHYFILLERLGYHLRAWIKWYETFGVCNSAGTNFSRTSRHLFYCVKDPRRFTFNLDAVNRPSDRQTEYNDARANPDGKVWDDVWIIPRVTGTCAERLPDFRTQLPLALLRPIIGCASDPGDLVVDPFAGSATTGVAAVEGGRRFLGFEKSRKFAELATLRMKGVPAG